MNTSEKEAKDLLVYYFRLLANSQGLKWNGDNDQEVRSIVDHIIAAAKDAH